MQPHAAMKPDFFIVGGPRCGTTALSTYLSEHPQICFSSPKEPNFFSYDLPGCQFASDVDEYRAKFFGHCVPGQHLRVGEGSVWYLFSDVAVSRVLEFNPDAKFIAMVRNPVVMVQSLHAKLLTIREETEADFERAWRLQAQRARGEAIPPLCKEPRRLQYQALCSFGEQVKRLKATAPAEQVRVIVFDDFKRDTGKVYGEMVEFLGLEHDGRTAFPPVNVNKRLRSPRLEDLLQRPPRPMRMALNVLKQVAPVKRGLLAVLARVRSLNDDRSSREALSAAMLEELAEAFRDDVGLLGEELGRDLSHWCKVGPR